MSVHGVRPDDRWASATSAQPRSPRNESPSSVPLKPSTAAAAPRGTRQYGEAVPAAHGARPRFPARCHSLINDTSSAVHLRSPSCPPPDVSHDAFSSSLSTPGSGRESHPPAPTDPDVNLSVHPARAAQLSGRGAVPPVREQAGRSFCDGGQPCPCPFAAALQALVFPLGPADQMAVDPLA